MISIGQLDDEGYTCIYGDNSWKIFKGSLQVAKGTKSGSLYTLHVSSIKDHVILAAKQPSLSLWHRWLGHMSVNGCHEKVQTRSTQQEAIFGAQESQTVKPGAGHGLRARLRRGLGDKEMTCKARVRSTDSERVTGPRRAAV